MSTEITTTKNKKRIGAQPVGLAARRAAMLEQQKADNSVNNPNVDTAPLFDNPEKMPDRIGIVFDDSGSMGYNNTIGDAHKGVEEFLRSSNPKTTAVAVYPMNVSPITLSVNLPKVATDVKAIQATGGTPALDTLGTMVSSENLTRSIMFSDGSFTMGTWSTLLENLKVKEMVVDTVYIGSASDTGAINNLKQIARDTGGIFLHFEPGKTSFARAFKYLSPGLRLMLMDASFRSKVEKGEI